MPDFDFYVMPIGGDTNENLTRQSNESIELAKGEAVQFRIDITAKVRKSGSSTFSMVNLWCHTCQLQFTYFDRKGIAADTMA